ncbi:MAG: TonB-dependent receptor [Marinomonas sp.]
MASAGLFLPSQAMAQDAAGSAAEEENTGNDIIVTARKIGENLQDAPLAITAFSEDTLAERGIDDLTEVARSTPGFSFENFNGAFATPVIRGQSQNRLTLPVQNVATFFNGVYLQRGYMIDQSMLNIGQVEILRGPQSAALGRNAYAGAINFTSKEPGNEFHGRAMGSIGENDYERFDVSLEGPIIPDVLSVIGGYSQGEYGGAWENNHALANEPDARTRGNLGGYDYTSYHIGAVLTPVDGFKITANYINNDRDIENTAQYFAGTASFDSASNTNNCVSNPAFFSPFIFPGATNTNVGICGEIPVLPTLAPGEARKPGLVVDPRSGVTLKSDILSVGIELEPTDSLQINYNYGRSTGSFSGAGSAARNPEAGLTGFFAGRVLIDQSGNGSISSDSHELRFTYADGGPITAYVGGYLADTDDKTEFALINAPAQTTGPLDPGFALAGPGSEANSQTSYEVQSLFGLLEYAGEQFELSLEGRYTEEKLTETDFLAAPLTSATRKFSYFTPRVTATYNFTPDNNVYISYGRGIKAGGFNVGGSNPAVNYAADPSQATFDTEENDTFEIGSRNALMGGDLIVNATVFYIDAKNLQVSGTNASNPFGSIVGNLGAATTYGLELETSYRAADSLNLYAGLGYAKAKYSDGVIDLDIVQKGICDDVACNANGDIGGNRLARTPSLTINAGFNFDQDVGDELAVFVNGNVGHQDKQFINQTNTAFIAGRTIVDASVGARYKMVEFKLAADNLLDKKYVGSAFTLGLGSSPFFFQRGIVPNLGDRRRITGSVTLSF